MLEPYPPSCKLKDQSGNVVGEWRFDGNQTIVSGIHPSGVPYRFVVEHPVVTVTYDQITWPTEDLLPPAATESKRVGEEDVVGGVCVGSKAKEEASVLQFLDNPAFVRLLPMACHQNNDSLFKLARLMRDYATLMNREATNRERECAFSRWAESARRFWRRGLMWDDYYEEFLEACSYARIGLFQIRCPWRSAARKNLHCLNCPVCAVRASACWPPFVTSYSGLREAAPFSFLRAAPPNFSECTGRALHGGCEP